MKIGILTFHDGINHGAYLQVYSLKKALELQGHQVQVINYKNFKHWINEYISILRQRDPKVLLGNIKKIVSFSKCHHLLNTTDYTFSNESILDNGFDAVVVGSDEVWNYKNPFFEFDPTYFGENIKANKLISYAASFGSVSLKDPFDPKLLKGLKTFNSISVRDTNSFQQIKRILKKEVPIVIDPVFLVDHTKEAVPIKEKNYVLVYAAGFTDSEVAQIKAFAKKRKKKLLSISYYNAWCDQNIISLNPFEYVGYFKKADFVITNTFHGTMFSIKFNKEFATSLTEYKKNKYSVLSYLGLEKRIHNDETTVESIFKSSIPYKTVNAKIEKLRASSLLYLKKSLA